MYFSWVCVCGRECLHNLWLETQKWRKIVVFNANEIAYWPFFMFTISIYFLHVYYKVTDYKRTHEQRTHHEPLNKWTVAATVAVNGDELMTQWWTVLFNIEWSQNIDNRRERGQLFISFAHKIPFEAKNFKHILCSIFLLTQKIKQSIRM